MCAESISAPNCNLCIEQNDALWNTSLYYSTIHSDTSEGEIHHEIIFDEIISSEMSTSMTPSEKIQLLGKHSGDTQLETPSSKRQRKSHPFGFDNPAETYIKEDISEELLKPQRWLAESEELPLMQKTRVSVPTTVVKVEDQVQYFDSKFRSLVNKAYQEVNGKVEPSDFLYHITCLPVSTRTQHRSFIEKKLTNIPAPATIVSIWTILNLYWDFLNYGLLEQVINACGSEGSRHQMLEYVVCT